MFWPKQANQLKLTVSGKQVSSVLYPGGNRRGITHKANTLTAQQMKVI